MEDEAEEIAAAVVVVSEEVREAEDEVVSDSLMDHQIRSMVWRTEKWIEKGTC